MKPPVFVVICGTGEYSDYTEVSLCYFKRKFDAQKYVDELTAQAGEGYYAPCYFWREVPWGRP